MTRPLLLLAMLTGMASNVSAEQGASCQQTLATLSLSQQGYVAVDASPLNGRVYLYLGDIKKDMRGFEPFNVWIVEGVYGKPFAQSRGSLDEPAFDRIRRSPNVRATPIAVSRGTVPTRGQVRAGQEIVVIEVTKVNPSWGGGDSVTVRVCR
jgi:hypothetical protein